VLRIRERLDALRLQHAVGDFAESNTGRFLNAACLSWIIAKRKLSAPLVAESARISKGDDRSVAQRHVLHLFAGSVAVEPPPRTGRRNVEVKGAAIGMPPGSGIFDCQGGQALFVRHRCPHNAQHNNVGVKGRIHLSLSVVKRRDISKAKSAT
jgi:hypothetical protein